LGPFHFSFGFSIKQFFEVASAFWSVRQAVLVDNLACFVF